MSTAKNAGRSGYILDTSALIAFLSDEPGAQEIARYLLISKIPFMAITELYYLIWTRKSREEADQIYGIVKSWRRPVLMPDEQTILNAGRFKAEYRLGIADSFIAACAWVTGEILITKDHDFHVIQDEIQVLWVGS